ncbi:protein FAM122A isoform X1 [Cimex lectularius]|uniref:Protein FAM122A n=1 Tax=Cimex lectularius TaxID=79782 RepID=A0A8I6RS54_CIMLE|nr:protein FAM122A isoform X1 [Cimex lectularius]
MASGASMKMDVDNPLVLKRSSSAPMINELNNSPSSQSPQSHPTNREPIAMSTICPSGVVRTRRFSTSCTPLSGPSSPKMTHRVNQLRREESVDVLGREAAHERELNSAMAMSQSWEDLTLVTEPNKNEEGNNSKTGKVDPLNLSIASAGCTPPLRSTPSPTTPLRHFTTFKTSLTPSPTSKFRSQSPIGLKPSSLGNSVKRKFELEENEPPAKRFSSLIIQQARFEPVDIPSRGTKCFDKIQTNQETACAQSGGGGTPD